VEGKRIVGNRAVAPRVVGGLKDLRAAAVGQFDNTSQVVGMRVIDLIRLPGLLYIHSCQPVGSADIIQLPGLSVLGNCFVISRKYSCFYIIPILFQNGFPPLPVGAVSEGEFEAVRAGLFRSICQSPYPTAVDK